MKRILSFILSAVMLLSLVPLSMFAVSAETVTDSQGVKYALGDDGTYYTVSGYSGEPTEVIIPAEVNGLPVKEIGNDAFSDCDSLTSIEIPDSVTSIGKSAFFWCYSLTSIAMPDSVTSIGDEAFYSCETLTSIEIPNSVTSISNNAFTCCYSLTSIEIPDSVTSIGESAFGLCYSLTSIEIPNSVTFIGVLAFFGCDSLTSVEIPDSVTFISECAFYDCNSLTSVEIPDSVTFIGDEAFSYCENLTDIYCEAESQPDGWNANWSSGCDATVHWGYTDVKITKQPVSVSVAKGETAKVTVTATGDGLTYKWYYKNAGQSKFSESVFANNYYSVTMDRSSNKRQVYCVVSDKYGNSVQSNTVTLFIRTFPDVPNTLWCYEAVEFVAEKGYITGYKQSGNFGPADKITRQDFVVILARFHGADLTKYSGRTGFPDVKAGSYYEAAVKWASANGIVNGYNNGKFGVDDAITREQLVTILYSYAKKMGIDVSVPASASAKLNNYTDAYKITGYAKNAVIWALHNGVISGMTPTTIAPQNTASRGQVATILMNICKKNIMG